MKKNVFGRQFKRDANERKALFKNLLTSLVLSERITTTVEKAKAIKGAADKLVTKAKKGGNHAVRMVEGDLNHDAVVKLIEDIAPRFENRQGGYTRVIKTHRRVADNAAMAFIEWTEKPVAGAKVAVTEKKAKAPKKEVKEATVKVDTKKTEKKTPAKKAAVKKETKTKKGETK